jgi:hypothetical protein
MSILDNVRYEGRIIYPREVFDRCIYMRQGVDPVYCYARLVHVMAQMIHSKDPLRYYIQATFNLWSILGIVGPQNDQYKPIIKLKNKE